MTGRAHLTSSGVQHLVPVMGFNPPFARVAAIIDMAFEVERIEQI
jgi:hypothetical protein